jgi:hypothetical protein
MGVLKNWIDRPEQYRSGDLDIMYDDYIVTAYLYRTSETGTNPGFSDEVDEQAYKKTITIRLDKGLTASSASTGATFVALTDDSDVKVNDKLVWTGTDGVLVNTLVKSAELRELGNELELDYV